MVDQANRVVMRRAETVRARLNGTPVLLEFDADDCGRLQDQPSRILRVADGLLEEIDTGAFSVADWADLTLGECLAEKVWVTDADEGAGTTPLTKTASGQVRSWTITAVSSDVTGVLPNGSPFTVFADSTHTQNADSGDVLDGLPTSVVGIDASARFKLHWEEYA